MGSGKGNASDKELIRKAFEAVIAMSKESEHMVSEMKRSNTIELAKVLGDLDILCNMLEEQLKENN